MSSAVYRFNILKHTAPTHIAPDSHTTSCKVLRTDQPSLTITAVHLLALWNFVACSRLNITLFTLSVRLNLDVFLVFPSSLDPSSVRRLDIHLIVSFTRAAHQPVHSDFVATIS